jgi:hypothetical protein
MASFLISRNNPYATDPLWNTYRDQQTAGRGRVSTIFWEMGNSSKNNFPTWKESYLQTKNPISNANSNLPIQNYYLGMNDFNGQMNQVYNPYNRFSFRSSAFGTPAFGEPAGSRISSDAQSLIANSNSQTGYSSGSTQGRFSFRSKS